MYDSYVAEHAVWSVLHMYHDHKSIVVFDKWKNPDSR